MSFKKWVMQRRALRFVGELQPGAAAKERYQGTVLSVVKFLHTQRAPAGDVRLVLKTGEANIKALGYIYGFTDAAFQIAGMDIGSEYGVSALVAVISEFDRPNADILWHRLKCPGDARALMDGVRMGFDDYCQLAESEKTPGQLILRWEDCFTMRNPN